MAANAMQLLGYETKTTYDDLKVALSEAPGMDLELNIKNKMMLLKLSCAKVSYLAPLCP